MNLKRDTFKVFKCLYKTSDEFDDIIRWLNIYYCGSNPDFVSKYKINNLTLFRKEVVDIMNEISYDQIVTYNVISISIAKKRNIEKMSVQVVGSVIGFNLVCIIVPCHRVVGIMSILLVMK